MYLLDLLSVFAFAFFGAHAGMKHRFTLLGVVTCAFLPALGGGTIREILLDHHPIYLNDPAYGLVVLGATLFAITTQRLAIVKRYMSILDALGMVVFAYLGASAAHHADLGIIGSIVFAIVTACGGGILCDLLTHQTPHAFTHRFYALPPLLLGALFWAMGGSTGSFSTMFLISGFFILQLAIIYGFFQKIPRLNYRRLRRSVKRTQFPWQQAPQKQPAE